MSYARAAEANLEWLLESIADLVADPHLTDLNINGVGEGMAFADRGSGMEQMTLPYSYRDLEDIAVNAAALGGNELSRESPIAEGTFPGGHRVHIVRAPCVPEGSISLSIRNPMADTLTPEELERRGVFSRTRRAGRRLPHAQEDQLLQLLHEERFREFLGLAIKLRLRIVFSGPKGVGKTTVMRSYTHEIPKAWRLITIEDAREMLRLPVPNVVHLLYTKHGGGKTARDLVEASARMAPDGVICQELRDGSASSFVNVLKSGDWGMTTLHADHAEEAHGRLAGLVLEDPISAHRKRSEVLADVHRYIDVVAHCARDGAHRGVDHILYDPSLKEKYAQPVAAE